MQPYSITPSQPMNSRRLCLCGCGRFTHGHRWYCGGHKARPWRPKTRQPIAERFWAKVDKSGGPDSCWLWSGTVFTDSGYGSFWHDEERGTISVHRFAWELTNGPVPPGYCVCHSCDIRYENGDITYRRCASPAHLFLGTSQDNTADKVAKNRQARLGNRKLTPDQVAEIRKLLAQGILLQREIGQLFGVTEGCVRHIKTCDTWKYTES